MGYGFYINANPLLLVYPDRLRATTHTTLGQPTQAGSNIQQRYYDPVIGRVLSRDAVTAYSSGDMRFFNGYAYAFNNPYKFNDPDGRCPSCAVRGAQLEFDLVFWLATRAGAATLGSWIGLKVYDITHHNEADEGDDKPKSDNVKPPQYPTNPDDWVPPDGWTETPAGEKTGGKHRQWKDPEGKIRRRWDREGREGGKDRGSHWHDSDDDSGGDDHIDPDDKPNPPDNGNRDKPVD